MITPFAALLKGQLEAQFSGINSPRPIEVFNPRLVASGTRWSEHAWGNALDIFGTVSFLDGVYAWLAARSSSWNGVGFGELLWREAQHWDHIHVAPNPLYHKRSGRYLVPPGVNQRPNMIPRLPVFPGDGSVDGPPIPGSSSLGVDIQVQMWLREYAGDYRGPTAYTPGVSSSEFDVSAWVEPSQSYAARQMDSIIPGEMLVTMSREFNWSAVELKPVLLISDQQTGKLDVERPLGVYYVNKDRRVGEENNDDDTLPTWRLWCVDGMWLLNRPVGRTVTISAGDGVVDKVVELIEEALGRTPFRPSILINYVDTTSGVDRVWEVQRNTTFLEIVQTLLADLGYGSLYVNPDGAFVAGAFLSPLARPVVGHYSSRLAPGRWTRIGYPTAATTQRGLPNKWIFYADNPAPGAAIPDPSDPNTWYEVENRYTGDESITGSLQTVVESVPIDADSREKLQAAGDRYAELEIQTANRTVLLKILPSAYLWHNNLVYLSIQEIGIPGETPAAVTFWRCPFDGMDMTMQATLLNPRILG